jgi:hypothetical protein
MTRPLTALVLAGSLAIATAATPTPAHARWGWGWGLGGLALGLFLGAKSSSADYRLRTSGARMNGRELPPT